MARPSNLHSSPRLQFIRKESHAFRPAVFKCSCGKLLQSVCIHSHTVVSLLREYCNASNCLVVLYCIIGGVLWGERLFPFAFFSVQCPVRFPIPETIRISPNSLFVQVSLRIEHHVRSLNVFTFLFNIHCLAKCLHCNSFAISYYALY